MISFATLLVFLPSLRHPIPTADLKLLGTCGYLLQTYFTLSHCHGEGHAQEGNDAVPVVKEDDVVPMVKEDDAVPMVNQDEAQVDPFGDRDD